VKYLPNILTSLRLSSPILFIFIIILVKNLHIQSFLFFVVFLLMSISDYFDGFLARKLNVTSNFGKIFDPISDKILTSSALIYLCSINKEVLIPSILIISREFLISGTREYSLIANKKSVNVSLLSKIKTSLQFVILSSFLILLSLEKQLLFYKNVTYYKLVDVCIYGLWLVAILTLYTGFQYCYYILQNKRIGNSK